MFSSEHEFLLNEESKSQIPNHHATLFNKKRCKVKANAKKSKKLKSKP